MKSYKISKFVYVNFIITTKMFLFQHRFSFLLQFIRENTNALSLVKKRVKIYIYVNFQLFINSAITITAFCTKLAILWSLLKGKLLGVKHKLCFEKGGFSKEKFGLSVTICESKALQNILMKLLIPSACCELILSNLTGSITNSMLQ